MYWSTHCLTDWTKVEIQIIGDTLAKVPVGKNANTEKVLDTLQHIG